MTGGLSRRDLLLGAAGLGASLLGVSACSRGSEAFPGGRPIAVPVDAGLAARTSGAPSFVVILSDDHRADHFGFTGVVPGLSTPSLDRLAAQGIVFEDSTVATALCSPSRASFVSGQYARRHGVLNNLTPWRDSTATFFESLAAAGYRCAFIGKWHMPGDLPDLRGVDRFVTFTIEEGQGVYVDCPLVIDGVATDRPGTYVSTDLTDLALQWISEGDPDQPYCLMIGHKAVHHPFTPPPDLVGALAGVPLMPRPEEAFAWQSLLERNVWEGTAGNLESVYRRYCETLLGLDREVGRVLDFVDTSPRADDTVVVYTSDNGYAWGEQTLTGKRWPFDVTADVPLIVRWPRGIADAGSRRSAPVINVDLAPTLLDLAGLAVPAAMQGRSWKPLLAGDVDGWRDEVYYEYFADFPYQVPPHQAVRTPQWLYVEFDRGLDPQLYDRAADPSQRVDLYGSPGLDGVISDLSQRLSALTAAAT